MKEVSIVGEPAVSESTMSIIAEIAEIFSRTKKWCKENNEVVIVNDSKRLNMTSKENLSEEQIYSRILTSLRYNIEMIRCAMFNENVKKFVISQLKKGKEVSV